MPPALRLGTRGSTLARVQAEWVASALRTAGVEVELVTVVTEGDVRPPDTAWGEGAFVGAIEQALLVGRVDLAVHSAKDVPIEPEEELIVAAFTSRADPRDAMVLPAGTAAMALSDLPSGTVVGTDSPRRTGFLLAARPDLRVVPLHGNVDTRLRRLGEGRARGGAVDALVLAVAGLTRLGLDDRISLVLDPETVTPAPGQGALALQVRRADARTRELVAALDDAETRLTVATERRLLEAMGGGCRAPVGALARVDDGRVELLAAAVEPDGTGYRRVTLADDRAAALEMAGRAAAELSAGALPGALPGVLR
jgi:hydroxymethylbilane synthase